MEKKSPIEALKALVGLFYSSKYFNVGMKLNRIYRIPSKTEVFEFLKHFKIKLQTFWEGHQKSIKKFSKIFLACFFALYIIQITVIASIDPNQFKTVIESKVLKETGMGLVLKGPIHLSGIKGIVLETQEVVLKKNPKTKYEMFKVASLKISPQLWYLLLGKLVFNLEMHGVQYQSYKIADLNTQIALKPNLFVFSKINLGLKKGREEGRLKIDQLHIDFKNEHPKYYLKHQGSDFPLFLLLTILGSETLIRGDTRLEIELSAEGKTLEMLKKSLVGNLEMEISKGAILGLDLIASLKEARSILTTIESKLFHGITDAVDSLFHRKQLKHSTPFSNFKIKAKILQGKLKTEECFVKHHQFHLQGLGGINFATNTLEYQVRAFYKDTIKSSDSKPKNKWTKYPLLIHIRGPLEKPDIKPDLHSYIQYVRQTPDVKPKETNADRAIKNFFHKFSSQSKEKK